MTRPALQPALRVIAAVLTAAVIFIPHVLAQVGSLRVISIGAAAFACGVELIYSDLRIKTKLIIGASGVAYIVAGIALVELIAGQQGTRLLAVNGEHLVVLLPIYALLGALILRSPSGPVYLRVFMGAASLVAVLSITESLLGTTVIGRFEDFAASQREGMTRALVAGETSLTLGVTLAAMVPLTVKLPMPWMRYGTAALLVAGTWATGSRGPAAIAAAVAIIQFIPVMRTFLQRYTWVLHVSAAAVILAGAIAAVFVWTPYIPGDTGIEYSSNYRGALYSLIPRILAAHPFGYLLGAPEAGRWMVDSELHGRFDITRSIDSEIAFAVLGLGWIGLLLYLMALFLSIAALRKDTAIGLASLSLTALGVIVALHGWDGMSGLWYALLGACASLVLLPRLQSRLRRRLGARALGQEGETGAR